MKRFILSVLLLALLCPVVTVTASPKKKINLKVLYVGGTPDFETIMKANVPADELEASVSGRMQSFEAFLKDHFTSVTVIRADKYTQKMSDNYDVTVMDGLPTPIVPQFQDRAKGIYLQDGYLTDDFSRPMLTIGYISDKMGRRIGTKNDWYCLCLQSDAHSWRAEHPIFQGPFDVKMTVVDKPTPEPIYSFPHHFNGKVPATLPMWKVQTYDYAGDEGQRVGLVSRPGGYEDSPEAEYISSGVCAKSPDAVAIGRHGNFFHWGFAASPAYLTEEAKTVLANAVVYISKFAGQTPIARKYNDRLGTRSYAKDLKQFLSREAYEEQVKSLEAWNKNTLEAKKKAEEKQARGEQLDQMEITYLSMQAQPLTTYEQHVQQMARGLFAQFGMDMSAYEKYFDDNYNYFYCDNSYNLEIDEDAKSLGIANNDPRILDAAIKMLETSKDVEKGRRILARYTLVDFAPPAEWRKWYDTYKNRLFFTESGGWVFLINSREAGLNDYKARQERVAADKLTTGETSDAEPVGVAAGVTVLQDGSRLLDIKVNIHPGYHIYCNVSKSDPFLPTEVEVSLPQGYTAKAGIKKPSGRFYTQNGTTVYKDSVVFSQEFTGAGKGELKCNVTYQCCDSHICFPPVTKEFTITL